MRIRRILVSGSEITRLIVESKPYWWEEAPRSPLNHSLPDECDVAIVGSGYTGLSAALVLLRAGKSVVIIERDLPGQGASSRNGGMMGSGHKSAYTVLKAKFGHDTALRILREGIESLEFTQHMIKSENIQCFEERCGRFRGAWKAADYTSMAHEIDWMQKHAGLNASLVSRDDQHNEIAVERYHGGCIFHDHGSIHPGLFHSELLRLVVEAGGVVSGNNPALSIANSGSSQQIGELIKTARGQIRAGHVIVATNGYRDGLVAQWQKASVPVPSFIIATESLGENVTRSLIPGGRMIVETRRRFGYYRASPDRTRIIFGGRAALHPIDTSISQAFLTKMLTDLFPQLDDVGISHSWTGFVSMTRDSMPHIAQPAAGVTVVGGYNGSGVAMAPYLGAKAAHRLLNNSEGETAFAEIPLPQIPFYNGNPWFLRPLSEYYRLLDKFQGSL